MKRSKRSSVGLVLALIMFACMSLQTAMANNMKVTNTVLSAGDYANYTFVHADISWDHSWRASWTDGGVITNWDAAWIFVKYRYENGAWQHASLDTTNGNHTAPAGSMISVGLSTNTGGTNFGAGVFLYRSDEGSGSWTNRIKLKWNYKQDGLASTVRVDVCVHAIEMVYVPQGSFYAGDGTTTTIEGQFEDGQFTNAFHVIGEGQLTLGGGLAGSLGNNNTNGMQTGDADDFNDTTSKILPAEFPKGYNAFYCMKYEITQGQYADFLNQLIPVQAGYRFPTNNGINRFTITSNANVYAAGTPDRACNWLCWADGVAYADWAGLRPMTELEFEKACRGPAVPVPNEYAWGNTTLVDTTNFSGADGSGMEIADPANANCNYGNNNVLGPVRCGIYATAVSGRTDAGAAYWGIMEMTGNAWEMSVTVGKATGRLFTGAHGDGVLNISNGYADVGLWPGSNANGGGFRGGGWKYSGSRLHVSSRVSASQVTSARDTDFSFRAVRTAP